MNYGYLARTTTSVRSLEILGKAEELSDKEESIITLYKEHKLLRELMKEEPENKDLELYCYRQYWTMISQIRAWRIDTTIQGSQHMSIISELELINYYN